MNTLVTDEPIPFKQPFIPKGGWLNYGLVIIMLLVIVIMLAKKFKPRQASQATCKLIEKQHLGNKTVVYILQYQQQRFLLVDNQHALAIQEVQNEPT